MTKKQRELRYRILEICFKRKFSHIGSCLSCVDLIGTIYRIKGKKEKFVLSNGHAAVSLYAVLEKERLISSKETEKLNVHPDRNAKLGLDVSTGSLGHGLPIAVGLALADRKKNVYCLISDGECMEGSIWESLRIARDLELTNLKIIVNANGWGAYSSIFLPNLINMFKGFGYKPIIIDGHNLKEIESGLKKDAKNTPLLLFAKTKVNQLPFLRGIDAHYYLLTEDDLQKAIKILK